MLTGRTEYNMLDGVHSLPVRRKGPQVRGAGVFLVLFGAAFGAFGVNAFLQGGFAWYSVMPLLIALGVLPFGLHMLIESSEYTFKTDRVEFSGRGILGRRTWSEPLSDYRGVLAKSTLYPGDSSSRGYTSHRLTLKHRHKRLRDIVLYQSCMEEGLLKRQETYARLLGVPALIEDE